SCYCGTCHKCKRADYMRAWWQAKSVEERRALIARRNPDRVLAYERARSRTPTKLESIKRSQARHPERLAARRAVHTAVAAGRVVKEPCFCGATKVEAHHPDYTKPLEVEWLCRQHHAQRHLRAAA
ncbi:MAG TPA: hypothetical protein VIU16_12075, partial [Gaiellaceae bacterium]